MRVGASAGPSAHEYNKVQPAAPGPAWAPGVGAAAAAAGVGEPGRAEAPSHAYNLLAVTRRYAAGVEDGAGPKNETHAVSVALSMYTAISVHKSG